MDVRDLRGRTALVTGAGSGIGKQTALALARRGADLVICDVNLEGMQATEAQLRALGRTVLAWRVDVAQRGEMASFAAEVHRHVDALDILVNNAGVGLSGGMLDTEIEDWDWVVGINLWGVIYGCHYFVPAMVERGRGGHVVNVSSSAGYMASSGLVAYTTTKFGVLGFSEAIRQELAPARIGVTAVCPGVINTAITHTGRMRGPLGSDAARQRIIRLFERRNYGPDRVATNILKAIQRNRAVAPISPEAWAMYFLKRLAPSVVNWINGRVVERARRELAGQRS
jgi:NAD(P)-dependent dehydrogenase (short-subunit alcohol dehydrogenase family)